MMDLAYRSEKDDDEGGKEAESVHFLPARSSGHVGPVSFT